MKLKLLLAAFVWRSTTPHLNQVYVQVQNNDARTAVRAAQKACPKAHFTSLRRQPVAGETIFILEFTGKCEVGLQGP